MMHKIKNYEISCKTSVQPCKSRMTVWLMPFECWILKATNLDSEYIILVIFLLQQ